MYEARVYTVISFMKLLILRTTWRQSKPYCPRHFRVSWRYKNTLGDQSKRTHALSKLFYNS